MKLVVGIAAAGAIGTLARYFLSAWAQRAWGAGFPIGTLLVNTLGCFFFGVVWRLAEDRYLLAADTRIILLSGFMGAFTTFSTYAFESARFMQEGRWGYAAFNLVSHLLLGVVALFMGFAAGRS